MNNDDAEIMILRYFTERVPAEILNSLNDDQVQMLINFTRETWYSGANYELKRMLEAA